MTNRMHAPRSVFPGEAASLFALTGIWSNGIVPGARGVVSASLLHWSSL